MTDLAMDLGSPLPTRATRREAAGLLGTSDAVALAQQADGTIFGPGDIGEDAVGSFWTSVERTRRSLLGELSLFGRWKATVNLSSLRRVTLRR